MTKVRAKKHLGQHFLKDESIAERIANSLSGEGYTRILEIGPGMGVLTQFLLKQPIETWVVEVDGESVTWLQAHFPKLSDKIIHKDFLRFDFSSIFGDEPYAVIGNFPYNISSQIVFKVLDERDSIPEFAGMFQKEVAYRIATKPGSKDYGILSVLCQAYYDVEYLFTVDEHVFDPPPKVKSGVMTMKRKDTPPDVDFKKFKTVVKTAFNQRRKTLRNAVKSLTFDHTPETEAMLGLRAEQLGYREFIQLTNALKL
ncbi:MAG: 16S rRNA (adenine(1518)-N(6)/adenine(1519)-N(6))-dimethyltransferase RsmA [Bacteroidetes bacterium]|uniref:Ribosomal RNA small subunit methyltransferase A n=1 Tax=Phaeocystidibacter marisrubri TaxID=1577780 RepID=A0A6L3ZHH8_9FLAO|nr:16S rRNA (adenine(1518)-N(6)/adenine(1519)-N(6))-dimethyltransferase RsmA [Phaeocystidibacter marisrubri]KAB2817093.1 16S rRNA (adenine(1518)-N(6)/adenine(1519)-N(6))-dimethyltransferase RsmA [Phaeocystidibacter marisrubri]TNE29034.1 MAG: 16S rRNA (adenine(1518)-N(6)/adenine(1519)-N(6))-dimethyltransferase RsmA [Bacteroidota bacterium]GGH76891.1 ribosomal RNA small subunit methyltransferase A [Phaeocystidibacter marisrubri]